MTSKTINLHKLLKLFGLHDRKLTSALRRELYAERKRIETGPGEGGDFHVPFWSDAKSHVIGKVDLVTQTEARVEASEQRKRLCPQLATGFLDWLEQTKRGTNERIGWNEGSVHSHHPIPELELTIKVDNLLALKIGLDRYRLIYPYFTEMPILSDHWARVGLWAMSEALTNHNLENMEILDILRGRAFAGNRLLLKGNERDLFHKRYKEILTEWDNLRPDYGL